MTSNPTTECPYCAGLGRRYVGVEAACPRCNGLGKVAAEQPEGRTRLELDIDALAGKADPDQWLSVSQIKALADFIQQREAVAKDVGQTYGIWVMGRELLNDGVDPGKVAIYERQATNRVALTQERTKNDE
jgi:hypothetical protein